jgi:hypothetical protein
LQKDHLIQLHAFLVQVRTYLEDIYEQNDSEVFNSYDTLNVHPHEVHKSKNMQQIAIFELMKNISQLLADKDPAHFKKISETLDYYCDCFQKRNIKK